MRAPGLSANAMDDAYDSLTGTDVVTDTFTVEAADGTAQTITVTINGSNDAASIGGTVADTINETDIAGFASGQLNIADADDGLFEEREVLNGRHDELLHWRRLLHGWF